MKKIVLFVLIVVFSIELFSQTKKIDIQLQNDQKIILNINKNDFSLNKFIFLPYDSNFVFFPVKIILDGKETWIRKVSEFNNNSFSNGVDYKIVSGGIVFNFSKITFQNEIQIQLVPQKIPRNTFSMQVYGFQEDPQLPQALNSETLILIANIIKQ